MHKQKIKIELLYDSTCPQWRKCEKNLKAVIKKYFPGLMYTVIQMDCGACDAKHKGFASPTILVNGKDIFPVKGVLQSGCRLYPSPSGKLMGYPSKELIAKKLKLNIEQSKSTGVFASIIALVPTVFTAFIFNLSCPLCWPAYAALFTSLGLGVSAHTMFIWPVMAVLLSINLFFLWFRAKRRRGYGPFIAGLIGSAVLIGSKYIQAHQILFYCGLLTIIIASIWNIWPKKKQSKAEL